MTTYKEIVYFVLDSLKLVSDDSHFTEEHILFLLDKFRTAILDLKYKDIKKEIPESNYQTICIDLEYTNAIDGSSCEGSGYLKSILKIPLMLTIGKQSISSIDYFLGNISYVNNERFKYVGNNKYLKNLIYGTISPDSYLYLKSNNPQYKYLKLVKVTGIFEDSAAASELQCPDENGNTVCDIMDRNFPIEEALVLPLILSVITELSGIKYQPKDEINNSNDDVSDLASFIRNELVKGRRSDLYKELQ